jgi:hypothetical protein
MNKNLIMLTIIMGLSASAFSQSVKQNIDKAAKNPTTKENAAKADVYIHKKKTISDSTLAGKKQPLSAVDKKKKKNCSIKPKNRKG